MDKEVSARQMEYKRDAMRSKLIHMAMKKLYEDEYLTIDKHRYVAEFVADFVFELDELRDKLKRDQDAFMRRLECVEMLAKITPPY